MSKMTILTPDDARPDVDGVLREFFETEMPKPWPAFKAPKQTREKRSVSMWSRYSGRVALAACVALLVAGYMTLAGFFPTPLASNGVHDVAPHIGAGEPKGKFQPPPDDEPMVPVENGTTSR